MSGGELQPSGTRVGMRPIKCTSIAISRMQLLLVDKLFTIIIIFSHCWYMVDELHLQEVHNPCAGVGGLEFRGFIGINATSFITFPWQQ